MRTKYGINVEIDVVRGEPQTPHIRLFTKDREWFSGLIEYDVLRAALPWLPPLFMPEISDAEYGVDGTFEVEFSGEYVTSLRRVPDDE